MLELITQGRWAATHLWGTENMLSTVKLTSCVKDKAFEFLLYAFPLTLLFL